MKFSVKVITKSKQNKLEFIDNTTIKAHVRSMPENGNANKELIEVLSKHFKVSKNKINIVSGEKSHNKIVEIID